MGEDRALYLLSPASKVRLWANQVTSSKVFEYSILVLIIASCIFMAVESPLEPASTKRNTIIYYCDMAVTVVFSIEVVLKILAKGFIINGEHSYMRQ